MDSLNRAYTRLDTKRRYESWFLRLALSDGSGAWWLRYLLTNPGRQGCSGPGGGPAQVWATWFPRDGKPQTFIQEFPVSQVRLHPKHEAFFLEIGSNRIADSCCSGQIEARGQRISWDLDYRSRFSVTLSNKGWIGFSRTPHSDSVFSGEMKLGEAQIQGSPLGLGVQGHNCGFRHRNFWTWTHACFPQLDGSMSTLESLTYEMPLGLRFRKAVLWHMGRSYALRGVSESLRDRQKMLWNFQASSRDCQVEAEINASGASVHRLPYMKTNCSGTFEVANNSRASAKVHIKVGATPEDLTTADGAVLEMAGDY